MSPSEPKKSRAARGKTERQAHRAIHELWRAHPTPAYQRRDVRLRFAAVVGIAILLVGLFVGDRLGLTWLMIGSGIVGASIFGGALWQASRAYKRDYQRFVVEHLADDGTFLFCPDCRHPLGSPDDPSVRENPPKRCPECGTKPWRLANPVAA
jgi:hypothetical protein